MNKILTMNTYKILNHIYIYIEVALTFKVWAYENRMHASTSVLDNRIRKKLRPPT